MAGRNTEIIATDYNAIQSKISNVLGTGSLDYGYGQTVASSQVARTNRITVAQWNNLRTDLLKARQHQTGNNEAYLLTVPTTQTTIKESDRKAYSDFADLTTANRLIIPPISEASLETLDTVTRTTSWATTISHTTTITFASPDDARYFFNSGGNIKFSSSFTDYTGGDSAQVNESWATLLSNMRIISVGANTTTTTGTGTSQNIGFFQLSSVNQLLFTKLVEAGNQYTPNQYDLYARKVGAQVIFTPTWSYLSGGAGGYADEPASGTLVSLIQAYRASGDNVSVPLPTHSSSSLG